MFSTECHNYQYSIWNDFLHKYSKQSSLLSSCLYSRYSTFEIQGKSNKAMIYCLFKPIIIKLRLSNPFTLTQSVYKQVVPLASKYHPHSQLQIHHPHCWKTLVAQNLHHHWQSTACLNWLLFVMNNVSYSCDTWKMQGMQQEPTIRQVLQLQCKLLVLVFLVQPLSSIDR